MYDRNVKNSYCQIKSLRWAWATNIFVTYSILCVINGTWFDSENLLNYQDYETYRIPLHRYFFYYIILLLSLSVNFILFNRYHRKSEGKYEVGYLSGILGSIYFIIFFILCLWVNDTIYVFRVCIWSTFTLSEQLRSIMQEAWLPMFTAVFLYCITAIFLKHKNFLRKRIKNNK